MLRYLKQFLVLVTIIFIHSSIFGQFKQPSIYWTQDGESYIYNMRGDIVRKDVKTNKETIMVSKEKLTPADYDGPLAFKIFSFSPDYSQLLIFTNTARVWRYNTRGDYWVYDLKTEQLSQLGASLPAQSLMYAKLSPDGKKAAYVSEHNIYMEDLASKQITQLTTTGTRMFINGTFDWVYEEEFGARDGFRWSPDSKRIAFWEVDATKIRDYYMINTTDSVYSQIVPVEYPKVGYPPSPVRIGVINVANKAIKWMAVPGDPQEHYIPRMEWVNNSDEIVLQQLNRKQNESKLYRCNVVTGEANNFYTEKDDAFIDIKSRWNDDDPIGWDWLQNGKEFLWVTEKDGWRHIYKVGLNGKETLVTKGDYDIKSIKNIDEKGGYAYFMASPDNPNQLYLYRTKLNGKGEAQLLSPSDQKGTHDYNISPSAKYAFHTFSSHKVRPGREWVSLPKHQSLDPAESIANNMKVDEDNGVEYFQVTTEDGITLDGWMVKPINFDSTKKYPLVFYVYGEPASSTVTDRYGGQRNFLFNGDMRMEGYIQVSVDNRGTPSLRGAKWRKSIYRKLGRINIHDQAMAAKKILENPWIDKDRVAVWGWSGGGSSTMNLMFQFPEIYKTGIAIAAVTNLLFYDNIYEERYMGVPPESLDDYIKGSPIHYAKNLEGNLLFIHGTGDDNVHYDNAEAMINELVKYNKQFTFMPYPNRSHGLSEGEGTFPHLMTLYTNYLREHCEPGARER